MRRLPKKVDREAGGPPKIIRALNELVACVKAGRETTYVQERVKRLFLDEFEVTLACIWAAEIDRLPFALEMKKMRDDAIKAALKRKDLTIVEGMKLYQFLNEDAREIKISALLEQRRRAQEQEFKST